MSFNQFHAAEPKEGRSAADVFASSSTVQSSGISSRFASSGKFTAKQLDDGDDGEAPPAAEEDEFDPDDKRPLYERLKAQKDAKEEEFQYNSAFKNQMDHSADEDEPHLRASGWQSFRSRRRARAAERGGCTILQALSRAAGPDRWRQRALAAEPPPS